MADERPLAKPLSNTTVDVTVAVVVLILAFGLLGAYINTVLGWYSSFLDWFYSGSWGTARIVFVVIISILDAVLLGFVLWVLHRHRRFLRTKSEHGVAVHIVPVEETAKTEWEEIKRLANSENPSDWNMAIIRADGLLDLSLQRLGYDGETMADRLKIVDQSKLPSRENIWSAHRLRNTIVHGPLQDLARETAVNALKSYESGLTELGVLKKEIL